MKKIINDPVYNFKTFQEKPSEKELKKYYKENISKLTLVIIHKWTQKKFFLKNASKLSLKVLIKRFKKSLSLIAEIGSERVFF